MEVQGLKKGAWSAEEDLLLTHYINKNGEGNWHLIPKNAGLNRCRKSCRLRWLNYLNPSIKKGKFGDDEIDLIIRLHKRLGNRWSLIAGRIPGRTANDIKNFWNCHIKKSLTPNSSNKKINILPKFNTPNKTEVIRPRARTFSKNLILLKKKSTMIQNIIHNTSDETKEITYQNHSNIRLLENKEGQDQNHLNIRLLENKEGQESSLWCLKSPQNKLVEVNIPNKDISQEQQGDDYWQQDLFTSHYFVSEATIKVDGVTLEEHIPHVNTNWDDFLWENMDIHSLLEDEQVVL